MKLCSLGPYTINILNEINEPTYYNELWSAAKKQEYFILKIGYKEDSMFIAGELV